MDEEEEEVEAEVQVEEELEVEVEGEEISKTNLSWPDSDRERSVSSLRVRYQGDRL